jgi:hypothetical protein
VLAQKIERDVGRSSIEKLITHSFQPLIERLYHIIINSEDPSIVDKLDIDKINIDLKNPNVVAALEYRLEIDETVDYSVFQGADDDKKG